MMIHAVYIESDSIVLLSCDFFCIFVCFFGVSDQLVLKFDSTHETMSDIGVSKPPETPRGFASRCASTSSVDRKENHSPCFEIGSVHHVPVEI